MEGKLETDPKKLIERAKAGDKKAFGNLYSLYFVPVFRYVYLRIQSREEAEDLTQTVFMKVYQSLGKYRDVGKDPLAYFFTVARNSIIDFSRKKKDVSFGAESEAILEIQSNDEDPIARLEKDESAQKIRKAISSLPEMQKEVIVLKYINEMTNEEIAKILDKNEAAIRQIQHRALEKLKKFLKEENGSGF